MEKREKTFARGQSGGVSYATKVPSHLCIRRTGATRAEEVAEEEEEVAEGA